MLGVTRWTPWTELAGLHRDLDSIVDRVFGEAVPHQTVDSFDSLPSVADVKREGDTWMVSIAVPGMSPDKIDVDIVGRTLRMRGERSSEEKTESVMSDIAYGRFERDFTLPDDIDAQHVQATYRHGMLELALPLKESAKPRRTAGRHASGRSVPLPTCRSDWRREGCGRAERGWQDPLRPVPLAADGAD